MTSGATDLDSGDQGNEGTASCEGGDKRPASISYLDKAGPIGTNQSTHIISRLFVNMFALTVTSHTAILTLTKKNV